jgi:hypothetical protein
MTYRSAGRLRVVPTTFSSAAIGQPTPTRKGDTGMTFTVHHSPHGDVIDPLNASRDTLVELDARETSEFEISLLWDRLCNRVRVLLVDRVTAEVSAIDAAPEVALDAFWHPFLYLADGC